MIKVPTAGIVDAPVGFRFEFIQSLTGSILHISSNWAAHPLTDYETVLKFIRTTKTSTGLMIRATLHAKEYQKGIRICDEQMKKINLKHFTQRPKWNYSITPTKYVN